MAAPVVTGMIALMQEYYAGLGWTNSPALMKALLINGARTVNSGYDFAVTNSSNGQGWGLPNLTNSLPADGATVGSNGVFKSGSMVFYDQHPERTLETGESFTRIVNVTARLQPLRVTLVWTDPPGNPAVGVKLVNNLDLVVTNLDTGEVFVGNGIQSGQRFNRAVDPADLEWDYVNNVENVYLDSSQRPLGARYSVTVVARRVNVNAVTTQPAGIVQDYALVISSGEPRSAASITVTEAAAIAMESSPFVQVITNGVPMLNLRVGANPPRGVSLEGATNQWRFFMITNVIPPGEPNAGAAGEYVAFRTFLPPNLGRARTNESDLDLYVSSSSTLTNLDPATVASAFRSVGRGGGESILVSNAASVPVFYAGVKAEDQQGANFGFFAISSSSPFSSTDTNGNVYFRGFPLNVEIPDGFADDPQAALVFGFNNDPITINNVVITNTLTHEFGGDLFGVIDHNGKSSILNANRVFQGTATYIYDDSGSGAFPEDARTDPPRYLAQLCRRSGRWLMATNNGGQRTVQDRTGKPD